MKKVLILFIAVLNFVTASSQETRRNPTTHLTKEAGENYILRTDTTGQYVPVLDQNFKTFLGFGQSNTLGNTDGNNEGDLSIDSLVLALNTITGQYEVAEIGKSPFDSNNGSDNFLFHFGKKEAQRCNCEVRLILSAFGGNPIQNWIPESSSNFQNIVNQLATGNVSHIDGILSIVGESNQNDTHQQFIDYVTTVRTQLINLPQISESTPYLIGGFLEFGQSNEQNIALRWLGSGQYDRYVNFVESSNMDQGSFANDAGVHFTSLQLQELGRRFHQAYLNTPHDLHDMFQNYRDTSGNKGLSGYLLERGITTADVANKAVTNTGLSGAIAEWIPEVEYLDTVAVQAFNGNIKFAGAAAVDDYVYFASNNTNISALVRVDKHNPENQTEIDFGAGDVGRYSDIIPYGQQLFLVPDDSDSLGVYNISTGKDTAIFVGVVSQNDKYVGGWVHDSMVYFCPASASSILAINPRDYSISTIAVNSTGNIKYNNAVKIGKYVMLSSNQNAVYPMVIDMETFETRDVYINQVSPVNRWRAGTDGKNFFLIPFVAPNFGFRIDPFTLQFTQFTLPNGSYSSCTFDGVSLWLTPISNPAQTLVKLDPVTLRFAEFDFNISGGTNSYTQGAIFDGEKMWSIPRNSDNFIIWRGGEFNKMGLSTIGNVNVGGTINVPRLAGATSLAIDASGELIAGTGGGTGGGNSNVGLDDEVFFRQADTVSTNADFRYFTSTFTSALSLRSGNGSLSFSDQISNPSWDTYLVQVAGKPSFSVQSDGTDHYINLPSSANGDNGNPFNGSIYHDFNTNRLRGHFDNTWEDFAFLSDFTGNQNEIPFYSSGTQITNVDFTYTPSTNFLSINGGAGITSTAASGTTNLRLIANNTDVLSLFSNGTDTHYGNLRESITPPTLKNGDIWQDGTNVFMRVGATTKQLDNDNSGGGTGGGSNITSSISSLTQTIPTTLTAVDGLSIALAVGRYEINAYWITESTANSNGSIVEYDFDGTAGMIISNFKVADITAVREEEASILTNQDFVVATITGSGTPYQLKFYIDVATAGTLTISQAAETATNTIRSGATIIAKQI